MSARNRELLTLFLAGLVASTAFAAAWIQTTDAIDYGWVPWALLLGGIFGVAHVVTRLTVPYADPTLLPLTALLCAIGLTFVYRLDAEDGRKQLVWVAVGVAAYCLVLVWLRYDYRILERYKYLFGISAIVLLILPSVPGLGQRINGVRLWVEIGPLQFQPGEVAKIFLVIFLAGYLRDKREALAQGRLKDFGPLLAIWGGAMLVLVQTSDLGSALLNFGIFLAMLYVATNRLSIVFAGSPCSRAGPRCSTTRSTGSSSASPCGSSPGRTTRCTARSTGPSSTARTATRTSSSRASTRSRTAGTAARGSETGRSRPSTGLR